MMALPEPGGLSREEYRRMWGVLDMSLSAHSILRDRYARRARMLTLLVMALSIVGSSVAFVFGGGQLTLGPITAQRSVWLGTLSGFVFFLALVDLVVDWRQRSWTHGQAARQLAGLKGRFRAATVEGERVRTDGDDLRALYEAALSAPPQIPEDKFVAMKAKHHRKVVLSKLIDTHKGAPVLFLRALAILRGLRDTGEKDENPPEEPMEQPPA